MIVFAALLLSVVSSIVVRADDCTNACDPPECILSGTVYPFGNSSVEESPQLILLIFEGSLNSGTYGTYYKAVLNGVTNPNGCPALGSFFFDHKYTDYVVVRQAWSDGHDAGVQSITGAIWNSGTSQDTIYNEIAGEKYFLGTYSGITDVPGIRAPNGNSAGDNQFQALSDAGFDYDVTLTSRKFSTPYWPYTLDCISTQDCTSGACPTQSYPGIYEFPVTDFVDGNGVICSNLASCIYNNTMNDAYNLLDGNFQYHKDQATPFVVPVPLTWLYDGNNTNGLHQFLLDNVQNANTYVVTVSQAVAWLQNPVGIDEIATFEPWLCDDPRPSDCTEIDCKYAVSGETVNFNFCYSLNATTCPDAYPWVDNLPWLLAVNAE